VLLAFICQLTIPYLTTDCPLYAAGAHGTAHSAKADDAAKRAPHQPHAAGSCALCAISGPGGLYIVNGLQSLPLPFVQADIWLPSLGKTADAKVVTNSFSARAPPA
jgi:hypothetical protein